MWRACAPLIPGRHLPLEALPPSHKLQPALSMVGGPRPLAGTGWRRCTRRWHPTPCHPTCHRRATALPLACDRCCGVAAAHSGAADTGGKHQEAPGGTVVQMGRANLVAPAMQEHLVSKRAGTHKMKQGIKLQQQCTVLETRSKQGIHLVRGDRGRTASGGGSCTRSRNKALSSCHGVP